LSDMSVFDTNYEAEKEPQKRAKYETWAAAKGMQAVDGLSTSPYLDEVARRNIEGDLTSYEAAKLIESYYEVRSDREALSDQAEADIVASRINILLNEGGFSLVPEELAHIHRTLFLGVREDAGIYRNRNFIKKEWILDGDSVIYGDYRYISDGVERYIRRERLLRYGSMEDEEMLVHLTKCISDLWQVHPFSEGNTRTIAVFAIKYFRYLGFNVDNRVFQEHSWYFRNALVRANYTHARKHIDADKSFLESFLSCVLFGWQGQEFHNRNLHILVGPLSFPDPEHTLDASLLADISADPSVTRAEMADRHNVSAKTIERHLKKLGFSFEGPSKTGHWVRQESNGDIHLP